MFLDFDFRASFGFNYFGFGSGFESTKLFLASSGAVSRKRKIFRQVRIGLLDDVKQIFLSETV